MELDPGAILIILGIFAGAAWVVYNYLHPHESK
jgi:hypothetical protein